MTTPPQPLTVPPTAPTLKDIAKEVGISVPAVSMALRGHPSIGEETRQRVLQVTEALGYKPRRRSTGNIAFLLIDRAFDTVYAESFEIIGKLALKADLRPVYLALKGADLLSGEIPQFLKSREVDGIICSGALDAAIFDCLKKIGVPLVVLGNYQLGGETWASCEIDIVSGTHLMMETLVGLGHRRIHYVSGAPRGSFFSEQIESSYHTALKAFPSVSGGVAPRVDGQDARTFELLRQHLIGKERPTALMVENFSASLLYDLCFSNGLSIPERISVGMLGRTVSEMRPRLTRIMADTEVMSAAAFAKLQALIRDPHTPLTREIFGMKLIPGGAIGPVPTE